VQLWCKSCSSKLDSPCPTTQNSLRLAAQIEKPRKIPTRRMGFFIVFFKSQRRILQVIPDFSESLRGHKVA
jgi:hypothetical protein